MLTFLIKITQKFKDISQQNLYRGVNILYTSKKKKLTQPTTQKIYNLLKDDLSPSKVKRHLDVVSSQRQTLDTIY